MRPIQHDSYLAGIEEDARVELVRNALHDRHARLTTWKAHPMGGGASGSELYTVSGEASSHGSVVPWTFILKMFNHEGEGWQESSTDPAAWDFWKREWLIYQAPWIRDLQQGLVAPRCFGSGELGDTAAWVAMEDLADADRRPWSPEHFATAARHLGAFNGRFVDGAHPYAEGWLSRDWVRGWTDVERLCQVGVCGGVGPCSSVRRQLLMGRRGSPGSRRSARSAARTNGLDDGVTPAIPEVREGCGGGRAPGLGRAVHQTDVRGSEPQVGDAQVGAPH